MLVFPLAAVVTYWTTVPSSALPYNNLLALVGLLATGGVVYIVERLIAALRAAFGHGKALKESWKGRWDELRWYTLVLAPLGGLLATLWHVDFWVFLLGLVPIIIVQRAYRSQVELAQRSQEVEQLAAATEATNSKLEKLQNLATTMVATRDTSTLLEILCDRLAILLGASHGWVVLLNNERLPLLVAWRNLPLEPGPGPHVVPWPRSYETVLDRQRVAVFTDHRLQDLAPLPRLSEGQYWNALIVIPLAAEEQVMGAICLSFEQIRGLTEGEQRILAAFARQAAMMLENVRLLSEVKESQNRLIEASKMEALGTFSAGIGHEFNNLLAGMLGYAQLGLSSEEVGVKNESLKVVVDTCKRGKSITSGLLTFSRRRSPRHELGDIREVVDATTTLMEIELRKSNITVERRLEHVPPTLCDLGQISQVVLNLLTNARDAMRPNGGKLLVGLTYEQAEIILRVSDTGSGIPESIRNKIFEPFVTTKGALGGSQTPGTGLGLAVSYGIVKEHGGTIEIDSTVGQGTTMIIRLPVAETPMAELPEPLDGEPDEVPALKLLVVDDDPNVATSLKALLERAGHQVVVANNATDALRRFREQPFEMVLTDLTMPGMNGIGLVRALNALAPDTPVLIFTGQASERQVAEAMQAGALGVLHKPFELEEILDVMKHAWHQRQAAVGQ
jgi:signal transduction histidine kinase/ActR/RegA family two-component response regulator